ncbi:DinB superfamily protein [Planctomycetes bacterium MalM25]|nr:DinB superfamily protein [Planctomycetes bacterium MalM25]
MNEQLITVYRFMIATIERLMEDVGEDQVAHQPPAAEGEAGVNPPGWILGHLALVNDMATARLGGEGGLVPESWAAEFGPGSSPEPIADAYPPMAELLAKLNETADNLAARAATVDLSTLTEENPFEPLRAGLPTLGDLIAHILSTHIGMHVGHLSNWRRQMGFPPLF